MQNEFKLGVIGAGNMAYAIVRGAINAKVIAPKAVIISDVDENKLTPFKDMGIAVTTDNTEVATSCTNLLFAVKPQIAPAVFGEIKDCIQAELVASIMAGVSISALQSALGNRKYARIMPNTPALVGAGMAAIAFSNNAREQFILDIFSSVGKVIQLDESIFDAVTSLSGSGPAYAYAFIKALIDGGVDGGLDYEAAKMLALQTVVGASKMIENSNEPIDVLIDRVCSKGGTTIEAINSFKEDGFENVVKRGMKKCRLRSAELAKNKNTK